MKTSWRRPEIRSHDTSKCDVQAFQKYTIALCYEVIIHQNTLLVRAKIHQIVWLRKHERWKEATKHFLNNSIPHLLRCILGRLFVAYLVAQLWSEMHILAFCYSWWVFCTSPKILHKSGRKVRFCRSWGIFVRFANFAFFLLWIFRLIIVWRSFQQLFQFYLLLL